MIHFQPVIKRNNKADLTAATNLILKSLWTRPEGKKKPPVWVALWVTVRVAVKSSLEYVHSYALDLKELDKDKEN